MAKAKQIEGLDCEADAIESATRVLRARFSEVLGFCESVLSLESVDGVHDMRVASRRLRSALRDFSDYFKKRDRKPFSKNLKRLADALGTVRDEDVAIGALREVREQSDSDSSEIDKLIMDRQLARERNHVELVELLTEEFIDDLEKSFEEAMQSSKTAENGVIFREAGREIITRSLDEMLSRAEHIHDNDNGKALHKLRIAAKRLRYAIQLFAECWNGSIDSYAKKISKLQTKLGEVHDGDAWMAQLNEYVDQLHGLEDAQQHSIAQVMSEFSRRRTVAYGSAIEIWSEWKANALVDRLRLEVAVARQADFLENEARQRPRKAFGKLLASVPDVEPLHPDDVIK